MRRRIASILYHDHLEENHLRSTLTKYKQSIAVVSLRAPISNAWYDFA